jgi:hypothetical protein
MIQIHGCLFNFSNLEGQIKSFFFDFYSIKFSTVFTHYRSNFNLDYVFYFCIFNLSLYFLFLFCIFMFSRFFETKIK